MGHEDEIMLDLETMDTGSNAAIVAIGAVVFDRALNKIVHRFYTGVSLQSAIDVGCTVNGDTVMWWLKQKEAARNALLFGANLSLSSALHHFTEWLDNYTNGNRRVWGNGSDFDNVILANAYKRCKLLVPWQYKYNRCYRTLCAEYPDIKFERPEDSVYHHALDDAESQAKHLMLILKQRSCDVQSYDPADQ